MKTKLKGTDILGIGGIVLTLAATIVSKVADKRDLEKKVAEAVEKAVNK